MPGPRSFTEEKFAEKFWARVDTVSDSSGCWLWMGYCQASGHGQVRYKGKIQSVHRLSYVLSGKTIPEGLGINHSANCVGKANCVNPEHLTPGTHQDNMKDMIRDGTSTRGEKNSNAKLTAAQVLEIRAIVDKTYKEIGEIYNIRPSHVSQIIRRITWKHI